MSTRGCEGVPVKPETTKIAKTDTFQKQNSTKRVNEPNTRTSCSFKLPNRSDLSPIKLFKRLGEKMAAVMRMMSSRRSCRKVTSSERPAISKSLAAPMDSHRAEAIDDCIQFINSSSSLPRSNSVSLTE